MVMKANALCPVDFEYIQDMQIHTPNNSLQRSCPAAKLVATEAWIVCSEDVDESPVKKLGLEQHHGFEHAQRGASLKKIFLLRCRMA